MGVGMSPNRNGSGSVPNTAHESGGRNILRFIPTRQTALKCSARLNASCAERKSKWSQAETTGHSFVVVSTNGSTGNMIISVTTQVEAERIRA